MVYCYIQILGCGNTNDFSPSLLLFFDNKRYLFNTPPNFCRFCSEKKIKLKKVSNIFFNDCTISSVGGFPGLVCTFFDSAKFNISVHGPNNLIYYLFNLRYYIKRKNFEIFCDFEENTFQDNNISVEKVYLYENKKEFPTSIISYNNLFVEGESKPKKRKTNMQRKFSTNYIKIHINKKLELIDNDRNVTICYIVKINDSKGKFNTKRAVELGVFGKNRSILLKGNSIKLENGTVVHPRDVIGEDIKGSIFIIIKCPKLSLIPKLYQCEGFKKYSNDENLKFLFHITPHYVYINENYQNFIKLFHSKVQNVVLNENSTRKKFSVFGSSIYVQKTLNSIDKQFFPFPKDLLDSFRNSSNPSLIDNLTKFYLQKDFAIEFDNNKKINEIKISPELNDKICEYKKIDNELSSGSVFLDNLEICFLGTGAAVPSRYRNVSGILLNLFPEGSILLDCGEGSVGQILRIFGISKGIEIISSIKIIWISHLHLDHHSGLLEFLNFRAKLNQNSKLIVIGPILLCKYLGEIKLCLDIDINNVVLLKNCDFMDNAKSSDIVRKMFGFEQFYNIRVPHSKNSYGIIIKNKHWKFVYSGDTRPYENLAKEGENATILIHEASFDDLEVELAKKKKHSTVKEAIEIGMKMNAKKIVLTHFSARYPKIPTLSKELSNRIIIAFDLLTLNNKNINRFHHVIPILQQILKEEDE